MEVVAEAAWWRVSACAEAGHPAACGGWHGPRGGDEDAKALQQHKVRVANLSDQKKFWQAKHRELEVAAAGKKARQIAAGNPTTNSTAGDNENVPTGGGTTAGGNEKNSTGGNTPTDATAGGNKRDLLIVIMAIMLASYKCIQATADLGYCFVSDVTTSEMHACLTFVDRVFLNLELFDLSAKPQDHHAMIMREYHNLKNVQKWAGRLAWVKKASARFAQVLIAVAVASCCGSLTAAFKLLG